MYDSFESTGDFVGLPPRYDIKDVQKQLTQFVMLIVACSYWMSNFVMVKTNEVIIMVNHKLALNGVKNVLKSKVSEVSTLGM